MASGVWHFKGEGFVMAAGNVVEATLLGVEGEDFAATVGSAANAEADIASLWLLAAALL